MAADTYRPDFYDRADEDDLTVLRCRPCGATFAFGGDSGRDRSYVHTHVGETFPCPNCGLDSRIPTPEESEWPEKKDHDDPVRGEPVTERERR